MEPFKNPEDPREKQIPIWFFVGVILTIYGVLILGSGIYGWLHPPEHKVALWEYHADVWWPIALLIAGLIYMTRFWPSKKETLTGLSAKSRSGLDYTRRHK
jgi:hypothetical protein